MSLFVRMAGDLPTMEKAFFRNAIAAMFAIVILSRTPEKFYIRKESWPDLIRRSLYGTMGVILNFWAIDHITIADASVLNKMSPFFAIIMSAIILKEKATKKEWAIVAVAFFGAVLVIKPTAGIASIPAFAGLLSGFGAGAAYTYVRKLGLAGERGPVIVMFFSAFSTLVLLPNLLLHYQPMTMKQLIFLIFAGMSAAGGQLSITTSYQNAPARDISVFDYSQVVYAAIFGLILFGEIPDVWSIAGYVIIIGTAFAKWYLLTRRTA